MPVNFVVDSSVILKWLYREDEKYLEQAELLLKNAIGNKVKLLAPELAKYEVGNVLLVAKKTSPKFWRRSPGTILFSSNSVF